MEAIKTSGAHALDKTYWPLAPDCGLFLYQKSLVVKTGTYAMPKETGIHGQISSLQNLIQYTSHDP